MYFHNRCICSYEPKHHVHEYSDTEHVLLVPSECTLLKRFNFDGISRISMGSKIHVTYFFIRFSLNSNHFQISFKFEKNRLNIFE
jgi:hypothetical protein